MFDNEYSSSKLFMTGTLIVGIFPYKKKINFFTWDLSG